MSGPETPIPTTKDAIEAGITLALMDKTEAEGAFERSAGASVDAKNKMLDHERRMNRLLDHWPLGLLRNDVILVTEGV